MNTLTLTSNQKLKKAISFSSFFTKIIKENKQLENELLQENVVVKNIADFQKDVTAFANLDEFDFNKSIRYYRNQEMARLSFFQSNHILSVEQIFQLLSDLAQVLILTVKDYYYHKLSNRFGIPFSPDNKQQDLIILAMGKLGGRELNFSSDIDLIFLYGESGETNHQRKAITNQQFFVKLAQNIIACLSDISEFGFVYRTDLRLRPFGENSPLVCSIFALEHYYQDQGRDWERYALIKSRILNNTKDPYFHYLQNLINSFVYRKYLDFNAVRSLCKMSDQIAKKQDLHTYNVKLGKGGIREIEFIVQYFQLKLAGRTKSLQTNSIIAAFNTISKEQLLSKSEIDDIKTAYFLLRHIENTLQAIDDQQVQLLPKQENEQNILIQACRTLIYENNITTFNINTWQDFEHILKDYTQKVIAIFQKYIMVKNQYNENKQTIIFENILDEFNEDDLQKIMLNYPLMQDKTFYNRLNSALNNLKKRSIGNQGQIILQELVPKILDIYCQKYQNIKLLETIFSIIEKIAQRTTYLALLNQETAICEKLFILCQKSSLVSEQIVKYPSLLDELLIKRDDLQKISLDYYENALEYELKDLENEEEIIEYLRIFKQKQLLKIITADILGNICLIKVSDHLTFLAQSLLNKAIAISWKKMKNRYGLPDHLIGNDCDLTAIAYGKLGAIELSYQSDLDLVFLHNAPIDGQTTGKKAISSNLFYSKVVQQTHHILSLNSHFGILYELDLRLRPSGSSGILVSSFQEFEKYQHSNAWLWEHQALIKARAVFASDENKARFYKIRQEVLQKSREIKPLCDEILAMREKINQQKYQMQLNAMHLKYHSGLLLDIEFFTQFLVLYYAHQHPQIMHYSDNIRILQEVVKCGILSEENGNFIIDSYQKIRSKVHHLSLNNKKPIIKKDDNDFENFVNISKHITAILVTDPLVKNALLSPQE